MPSTATTAKAPAWGWILTSLSALEAVVFALLAHFQQLPFAYPVAALATWVAALQLNLLLPPATPAVAARPKGFWARLLHRLRQILPDTMRAFRRCLVATGALAALALMLPFLLQIRAGLHASETLEQMNFPAVVLLVAAFLGYFGRLYAQLSEPDADRVAQLRLDVLGGVHQLAAAVFGLLAVVLFVELYAGLLIHPWVALVLCLLLGFWIIETLLRWALRFYQPRRIWLQAPPLGTTQPMRLLIPRSHPLWQRVDVGDAEALFKLSEMWFLPSILRALPALAATVAVLSWVASSFHSVPLGHQGLHQHLGRTQDQLLQPGLHVTLPFPFGRVETIPADELRMVVLGLQADTGEPILWNRDHYVGEVNQLVGVGEELLTISVPIYYHIKDPRSYFLNTTNPEVTVSQAGYQALLHHTLHESAFGIMTTEREDLQQALHEAIQAELDSKQSGISIDLVCLRDIHPPVEVGPSYQEVVSAEEDREAYIHDGQAYQSQNLPRAQSQQFKLMAQADAKHAERVSQANGEANSFLSVEASYQDAPEVFRVRKTYEAFDESLSGVKKLVVDESFQGSIPAYIDVRKTLNPDLINESIPAVQTLIPALQAKPTEFDRAVDGYLRAGTGAIPAVNPRQADADYLLEE
ncbi:MAG: protease modulator HflK [Verrucomicrobiota bacterium JB022]|nr:protease modulator HflK [Verrucomicrobiota bacterium JB022]